MEYKKCVDCKRMLPEHLVEDYPNIFKSPICPICARTMTNKMLGKPPGTRFRKLSRQEDHVEATHFISYQCAHNRGGHIINPPTECKYSFTDPDSGVIWVDASNCNISCKNLCVRYYQFRRMSTAERKEELFDNGVKIC